jgi:hypothetical protein
MKRDVMNTPPTTPPAGHWIRSFAIGLVLSIGTFLWCYVVALTLWPDLNGPRGTRPGGGGLFILLFWPPVALKLGQAMPRRKCPDCGEPSPAFRWPANRKQALWGGWTCAECGCEADWRGRKIESR